MSEKIKAAEDIRNFARIFKNMVSVADQLEKIGQLEQVEAESDAAVSKARAELAAVQGDVAGARARLAEVQTEIEQRQTQTNDLIELQLANTNLQAQDIVGRAETLAASLESQAKAQAQQIVEQAKSKKAAIDEKHDLIVKQIEAGSQVLADQEAELNRLNAAIAGAREQIAKLMGN